MREMLNRINLRKYNQAKMAEIENDLHLDPGMLEHYKKEGFLTLWLFKREHAILDEETGKPITAIFAATHESKKGEIIYSLKDFLLSMDEYVPPMRKKNYDTEKILEKINTSGLESLSKGERKYLDNLSKNL